MAKKSKYKMGEACRELDIQPYVLRYWETEFPQLSEGASGTGQRVYSAAEIDIIRRIKELLYEEGYTIAGAKKKLESEVEESHLGLTESSAEPEAAEQEPAPEKVASAGSKSRRKAPAKTPAKGKKGSRAVKQEQAALAVESDDEGDSADVKESLLSQRIELIRSDLRTLRDEARLVAEQLRDRTDS